jgi:hypothetical protein
MPKRNPNRRRKSSRRPHTHDTLSATHCPDASFGPQGYGQLYDGYGDIPGFSEDSIQRQLGYMIPVPLLWVNGHTYAGDEYFTCSDHMDYDGHEQTGSLIPGPDEREVTTYYQQPGRLALPPLWKYVEGYHDPILEDQTEDWWRLFGHDIPVQFILQSAKGPEPAVGYSEEDGQSDVSLQFRCQEPTEAEGKDGSWNVAAYFAPYRTPEMEACSTVKRASVGVYGYGNGKNGEEGSENDVQSTVTGEPIDGFDLRYRGRDDWDCDFCGLECFCWTVEASGTEV